ncbi:MAG: acyltransferase [Mucilaginibacter polytrichastri]|nr:acyltransferase [Mucilaginibacter polytrichastri]
MHNHLTHRHIPYLDGIRGMAILLVLIFHCFDVFRVAVAGWIGVDLFFVLSGFLITGILLRAKNQDHYFRNFLVRRSLRIFPLYYLFLFLFFFAIPSLFPLLLGDLRYYQQHTVWFLFYAQNWLYSFDGFPQSYMFHHLWSLAIEEQFYIFWPLIIYLLSYKNVVRLSIVLIVLANIFRLTGNGLGGLQFPFHYVHTFSRMDALIIGALVAIANIHYRDWLRKYAVYVFSLSIFVCLGYLAYTRDMNFWSQYPVYTFIDLFFAAGIAISLEGRKLGNLIQRFFSAGPLIFLGKYSYGLYIYHYPVYLALILHVVPVWQKVTGYKLAMVSCGLITVALSIVLSLASFHFFEKPFLRLKDRFSR